MHFSPPAQWRVVNRLFHSLIKTSSLFDFWHSSEQHLKTHADDPAEQLRDHLERMMIMQRVETELHDRLDVGYVLDIGLDAAVRASRAHAGGIALIDDDTITCKRHIGSTAADFMLLRNRSAERIQEAQQAQITIPLVSRDRVIGVLHLQTTKPEYFTRDVFEFIKLMAGRIAVAVDNAQLYHTSQQQVEELKALYSRVSDLERAKTDMIRIAAHDLRAPLSVINGFTGLLSETSLTTKQQEYLVYIQKSNRQMHRLIHDILSVERIEVMQTHNHRQRVALRELVEASYFHHKDQARQKRLDYRLHLGDETLLAVGDTVQLREAIDNLIGNAVKYTPAQGRVEVRLTQAGQELRVEIEDNGYGIQPELQSKLFHPFYRALSKETKDIDGTGLGLHLVKNIVERHNGHITFNSIYGKGSLFGFSLPLAPAPVETASAG